MGGNGSRKKFLDQYKVVYDEKKGEEDDKQNHINKPTNRKQQKHINKPIMRKEQRKKQIRRRIITGIAISSGLAVATAGTFHYFSNKEKGSKGKISMLKSEDTIYDKEDLEIIDMVNLNIEDQVESLKNEDDVLNYMKDFYIEEYEKETGDQTLTTKNTKMTATKQNYIYINNETGEFITHGLTPAVTGQKLKEKGINYSSMDNVTIYKIEKIEGEDIETIDCGAAINGKLEKLTLGEELDSNKQTPSILTRKKFSPIILKGFDLIEMIKNESTEYVDKMTNIKKKEMIELIKQYQQSISHQTEIAKIEDDEMEH